VRTIDLGPGEAVLHDGDPQRRLVVLPGVRYFSQAPLLWFAREAAQARGWSALELSERAPPDEEPLAWMRGRAARALDSTGASTIAVVGKSLGSVAAPLATERAIPAVWLTPLLTRPEVADAVNRSRAPTLLVGSPEDPTWGGAAPPIEPAGDHVETLVIAGLDHSLQVPGDPVASLDVLRDVTEAIGRFLDRLG
jgi:hypothetical protein